MIKQGILLAAFGSGSPQGETTLRLFHECVRERFPTIPVRWAFTSVLMRRRLAEARKKTDSVTKALQKMAFERYTHVAVQSLHAIPGAEYADLLLDIESFRAEKIFTDITVGTPLLSNDCDVEKVAVALLRHLPIERKLEEHVIFMGHGSQHPAEVYYELLAEQVHTIDMRVHIGTMDGTHRLEHIIPKLYAESASRVWLLPFLSIVGRHATEDMAGASAESWRSQLEANGFLCTPVLRGLAESSGFIDIWLEHLGYSMNALVRSSK